MRATLSFLRPLALFAALFVACMAHAQDVEVPRFDDDYSRFVARLEAGDTTVDFQAFRYSLLESEQFSVVNKRMDESRKLKEEMYKGMDKKRYEKVIGITKQLLSIDYTDMMAHKVLRQTYAIIGDTVNAAKYKRIQFGLLRSITEHGDGSSCATAWPVVQVSEEYFILYVLDAKLKQQSVVNDGARCDRMEVTVDGEDRVYYFNVDKVFEGYGKMFGR